MNQTAPIIGGRLFDGLQRFDIGHADYTALIDPDTAFWALERRDSSGEHPAVRAEWQSRREEFRREMEMLRFHLTPSAVYVNPTERCNLDCSY